MEVLWILESVKNVVMNFRFIIIQENIQFVKKCTIEQNKLSTLRRYHTDINFKEKIKQKANEWYYQNIKNALKTKEEVEELRVKYKTHYQQIRDTEKYKTSKSQRERRRKNRKKQVKSDLTFTQWESCLEYFDNKCAACGNEDNLQQDHYIPVSKGGWYTASNIIPLCGKCNNNKKNKNFHTWYSKQTFYSEELEGKIIQYLAQFKNKETA